MQVVSGFHSARSAMNLVAEQERTSSAEPTRLAATPAAPVDVSGPEASGSASSLRYRRSERTTLFIRTQEGDLVRLSFRTRESVNLQTAHAQDGDGEARRSRCLALSHFSWSLCPAAAGKDDVGDRAMAG